MNGGMMEFKEWLLKEEVVDTDIFGFYASDGIFKDLPYNIYMNPSKQELLDTIEAEHDIRKKYHGNVGVGVNARGFLSPDGDIYIWPESAAEHEMIADKLATNVQVGFYISDKLKLSTYRGTAAMYRIKDNPHYRRMMGEKVSDNPNYLPTKIWAELPPTTSWKDALKKKVEPGGVSKLPYESVLI